jgi:nucleotide-binding universal stress UspA family protein
LEFKKVLFPVDLSEISTKLVGYAQVMLKSFSAELHLINVMRNTLNTTPSLEYAGDDLDRIFASMRQEAKADLDKFAAENFADLGQTTTAQLTGNPSDEILEYIEAQGIDLVVMGTHGRRGLDKVMFGSVAQRIVQMSTVPVLTVNPYRVKD